MNEARAPKVLVVAPGLTSRGGINSVLRVHRTLPVWLEMNCDFLSTHKDGSLFRKILEAVFAYVRAPLKIARADLVHLHLAGQVSLLRKVPIVAAARMCGKSVIVHVHASSPESLFRSTPSWAVRFVLGRADCILALSNSWASVIRDHLPAAKIFVVPNPVLDFLPRAKNPNRERIVLFVGKLEPRKGYMTLLDAVPAVLQRYPEVQFWFAGHGDVERAQEQAGRLGITSAVRLLGWTEPGALADLYQEAFALCLPSQNEGVPMSVLEAMSHGLPVVCTPVGGLPELITDGYNGLFATVGDPASVADKILRLLDDPEYADRIAETGRRTVQQLCGASVVAEKLRQIYWSFGCKPAGRRLSS